MAELELLPPPLPLPVAWLESREAAREVLAEPQLGAFCRGMKSWLSLPPALGNALLQGDRETLPGDFKPQPGGAGWVQDGSCRV